VRKYGFHGLSCESIVHAIGRDAVIVAHLGNSKLTAIANGLSVDTTMGLTLRGVHESGRVISIRGCAVAAEDERNRSRGAGETGRQTKRLLGISGCLPICAFRRLTGRESGSVAIEMLRDRGRRPLPATWRRHSRTRSAGVHGRDREHDALVRAKISEGMGCFGVRLDREATDKARIPISAADSTVRVRVVTSDEEAQIARIVFRLLKAA